MIARLIIAAVATLGACAPTPGPADEAPVYDCQTGGITILHGQAVDCDLHAGDTLTVIYNDATEGDGWGGDASVEAAATDCDDTGGVQVWLQNPYRMACVNPDF